MLITYWIISGMQQFCQESTDCSMRVGASCQNSECICYQSPDSPHPRPCPPGKCFILSERHSLLLSYVLYSIKCISMRKNQVTHKSYFSVIKNEQLFLIVGIKEINMKDINSPKKQQWGFVVLPWKPSGYFLKRCLYLKLQQN